MLHALEAGGEVSPKGCCHLDPSAKGFLRGTINDRQIMLRTASAADVLADS